MNIDGFTNRISKDAIGKRFLFIIPPYFDATDYQAGSGNFLPAFTVPYGILSLVTFLESKISSKVKFDILDLNVVLKNCVEKNQEYQIESAKIIQSLFFDKVYDVVGISALFNSAFSYLESIASLVKDVSKTTYIMCGGGLPSAAYAHVLKYCPSVNAICKGEGELPLLRVLSADDLSAACDSDESFVTQKTLSSARLPKASYVFDLDEIPPLKYEILNLDNYNSRSIDKRFSQQVRKREMAIHTSRGCPFKCVFCSNPSLHGYEVRFMSLEKVEQEVVRMKNEFGMTVLLVEDDHFFHDQKRAKQVLRIFAKHNIRAEFPNGMAVYAIDDEVAELLKKAGVSAAALAVESGSDYVLSKLMKKPLKTKFIKPAVEALRRNDVRAHMFIVAGIPGETDSHREETRQMLLGNDLDWVHIYCAVPIFGSRLFDICMESNYIDLKDDPANFVVTKSVIKTPEIDPEKLQRWVYKLQIEINFLRNANVRLGAFDRALPYFENVVEKYPSHAFGLWALGTVLENMNELERSAKYFNLARDAFRNDEWRELAADIAPNLVNELESRLTVSGT